MPLFYFIITAVANQFSAQVQAEVFKYLFNDCCSVWYHCKILVLLCTFSKVIVFNWDFSKQSDNKEIIMELHLVIHLILKEVKNIYCYAKINFSLQIDFFFFPKTTSQSLYTFSSAVQSYIWSVFSLLHRYYYIHGPQLNIHSKQFLISCCKFQKNLETNRTKKTV